MRNSPKLRLKKIGPVSWTKLFRAWEKREASQPMWIKHYRQRGYASWREWRTAAFSDLKPQQKKWTLYQVENPERIVSTWFGGPFRGWRKHYPGRTVTFKTLAQRQAIRNNGKVLSIMHRPPTKTQMLGVIWRGKIVVIEGMHRACAVALASKKGKKLRMSITIALAPLAGPMPNLSSGQKKS